MSMRRFLATAAFVCMSLHAQTAPSSVTSDPVADKAHPAAMAAFQLPSHGEQLNAIVYVATGAGPHPVVLLLHGFPGNERNLDVAQAIRRAGWDVMYFNYRGSWGSPGSFSFTHSIEDAQAAIAYLRDPANAQRLRSDPKNIVVIGHSMGGFITGYVGAHDPGIRAIGLISAADMGGNALPAVKSGHPEAAIPQIAKGLASQGMAPLAGTSPEALARELLANAAAWTLPDFAGALSPRPVLEITSDDGLAPVNAKLVEDLHSLKDTHVTTLHLATDHSYSDKRIALQTAVVKWLGTLNKYVAAMEIRDAVLADFEAITAIYNDIVLTSTAIYNEKPATLDERVAWWRSRQKQRFPVLVATEDNVVLGFASFGDFRSWPGYRFTVEGTIHLAAAARGRGIGRQMLDVLIERARALDKHIMIAGVDSENAASLRFLTHYGFEQVAHLHEVGYKFGRYLDLVILQYWLTPQGERPKNDVL